MITFLDKNDILSHRQFGFRKNLSTYMAALDIVNYITKGFDNKEGTIGIFLDLSKALDTVNHNILLGKLAHYGIRGVALDWFYSYLIGRSQIVNINKQSFLPSIITCGVPQGSILGPLLFLIYINDLSNISTKLCFALFADDTSILYKHKNIHVATSDELIFISNWFRVNKLYQ